MYIDKILPNTEAARLKQQGKIKEGDEVTMVSATFGDEMWSARELGQVPPRKVDRGAAGHDHLLCGGEQHDKDKKNMQKMGAQKKEQERLTRACSASSPRRSRRKKKKGLGLW